MQKIFFQICWKTKALIKIFTSILAKLPFLTLKPLHYVHFLAYYCPLSLSFRSFCGIVLV